MRIGVITSSYATSAADTVNAGVFVRDLSHDLARIGHDVFVISPRKFGEVEYSSFIKEYYFPWLGGAKDLASASMRNPVTIVQYGTLVISGLFFVQKYAKEKHLDALLSMWAIPSGLFCWWTKYVLDIPYGVWALGSDIWSRNKYFFGNWAVKKVLQNASFRFADGIQLAQDAEAIAGLKCEFVPSSRRLAKLDNKNGPNLKKDLPNLLFIGRYELNKGPDLLVESAKLLIKSGCKFYLHMFGVGSLQKDLLERVRGFETFIHINGIADPEKVALYMRDCDWLVIPSRIESIPLIFSDAIQMHLPVIATDVGDMGKLTNQLGIGYVVPSADKDVLARYIKIALLNPSDFSDKWENAIRIFDLHESTLRVEAALQAALTQK